MKKICIYPRKFGLGGPASFQSRLIEELRSSDIHVVFDPDDLTVSAILVIGGTRHLRELNAAKKRGVRIVQRLNGMNWVHRQKHTGLKHYIRAEINNWLLSTIRRNIADKIIYQSEFSQDWWLRVKGTVDHPETIIYNGVNLDQFTPAGVKTVPADHYRMLLIEGHLGNGYEQGLFTAISAASLLNQRLDKPLEVTVVGDVSPALQRRASNPEVNIFWKGVVDRSEIPELDRSAHFLFSSDVNAACPNSVIEAMACGLPIVGYDTGALPEMLTDNAGRIARYGTDPWKLEKPDLYALADSIQEVLRNRDEIGRSARRHAENNFDIKQVAQKYIQVLLGD